MIPKNKRMPWNDQIFRDAVAGAAQARGKSRTTALKEAGISTETFAHPPDFGRRIDIFERLMPVLGWSPADVLRLICRCFDWPEPGRPPSVDNSGTIIEIRIVTRRAPSEADATPLD